MPSVAKPELDKPHNDAGIVGHAASGPRRGRDRPVFGKTFRINQSNQSIERLNNLMPTQIHTTHEHYLPLHQIFRHVVRLDQRLNYAALCKLYTPEHEASTFGVRDALMSDTHRHRRRKLPFSHDLHKYRCCCTCHVDPRGIQHISILIVLVGGGWWFRESSRRHSRGALKTDTHKTQYTKTRKTQQKSMGKLD